MATIIIYPKSKEEADLLSKLLKKMNIEANIVEESEPNYQTKKAILDVENKKGTRVKDSDELFKHLGI